MTFKIKALEIFLNQVRDLDEKSKKIISSKIKLIGENPYRFKRIHSKLFSKVFRIRLNLQGKEARMIYVVIEPDIILVCLLERKGNYADLEKYLKKLKMEK